jgi:uncharacterized membrane protein YgcG
MKKVLLVCFLLAAIIGVAQERILDFQSTILVNKDRSVDVTEIIKVNVEGYNIQRGIYRDVITTMQDDRGKRQKLTVRVNEVLKNGTPENFITEPTGIHTRIKIGNADIPLDNGEYTYTIKYNLNRQVRFFENYDEVYWNGTGNEWMFSIEKASVTVVLPEGADITQHAGYSGPSGVTGCACTASQIGKNSIRYDMNAGLNPYEGLTVAVGWQKGIVLPPTKEELDAEAFSDNRGLYYGAIGLLILFGYLLFGWFRVGRDPKKGAIIPRFTPPDGFSPAACRYVLNMDFDDKSFTASIVSMAVKGFLVIDKSTSYYRLEKKTDDTSMLSTAEKKVAEDLFHGTNSVTLSGTYDSWLAKAVGSLRTQLDDEFRKVNFKKNYIWMLPAFMMALGIFIIMGREIIDDDELATPVILPSMLMIVFTAIVVGIIVSNIRTGTSMILTGFQVTIATVVLLAILSVIFLENGTIDMDLVRIAAPYLLIVFATIFLIILFWNLMQAPTVFGRKRMDEIEGLRMFMEVAEKNRLNMLNPPDKTPQLFEQLLPYAIALNVENAWGKQFNSIIAKAIENNEYRPTWYVGNTNSMFQINHLTSNLSSSMSSAVSSTSTPPSSSSSGSSGGGSSGGGGGGGGGGGW